MYIAGKTLWAVLLHTTNRCLINKHNLKVAALPNFCQLYCLEASPPSDIWSSLIILHRIYNRFMKWHVIARNMYSVYSHTLLIYYLMWLTSVHIPASCIYPLPKSLGRSPAKWSTLMKTRTCFFHIYIWKNGHVVRDSKNYEGWTQAKQLTFSACSASNACCCIWSTTAGTTTFPGLDCADAAAADNGAVM